MYVSAVSAVYRWLLNQGGRSNTVEVAHVGHIKPIAYTSHSLSRVSVLHPCNYL